MAWLEALQSMLPRPEGRSDNQIENDLDDEFAFHLDQAAQDAMREQGCDPAGARDLARRRFGDIESIKKRCKHIALEERIMLQRVNFVMIIVVTLLVVGVGVQVLLTQRSNAKALSDITAKLSQMKPSEALATTGPAGHVLVQGDVPKSGWFPIPFDRVTRVGDVLKLTGARENQWVYYRHGGQNVAGSRIVQVRDYIDKSSLKDAIIQPDDELVIADDIHPSERCKYFMNFWETCYEGCAWTTPDPKDPSKNWQLVITGGDADAAMKGTLGRTDGAVALQIQMSPDRFSFRGQDTRTTWFETRWDVQNDRLSIDFREPRRPVIDRKGTEATPDPLWPEQLTFPFSIDKLCGERFGPGTRPPETTAPAANGEQARAAAIGEFILNLYASVDSNDPDMEGTIRKLLDKAEQEIDVKYADDPVTANVIRELIAGRRKIMEADAQFGQLATAEARNKALTSFLSQMLTSTDPSRGTVTVSEVLDSASRRIETDFTDQPEVQARLRKLLSEQRSTLVIEPAATSFPNTSSNP